MNKLYQYNMFAISYNSTFKLIKLNEFKITSCDSSFSDYKM